LNTSSTNDLFNSVISLFNITKHSVLEYIAFIGNRVIENRFDEYTIDKFPMKEFIQYCNVKTLPNIDEIIVNHITPRIDLTRIINEDIMTLPNALIKDTELSRYLKKKGFVFRFENDFVVASRNGYDIDFTKLKQSEMMIMRFGGKYSLFDFNINGYLFTQHIIFYDCKGWLGSPEILKSIANAYDDIKIANDFADNSQNYLLSFRVPISNIDIESTQLKLPHKIKSELLLKYSINTLIHELYDRKHIEKYYNPTIMLDRDYTVPNTDIIYISKIQIDDYYSAIKLEEIL
jgi:hypothetical protein